MFHWFVISVAVWHNIWSIKSRYCFAFARSFCDLLIMSLLCSVQLSWLDTLQITQKNSPVSGNAMWCVCIESVNNVRSRLDKHWENEELRFDYRSALSGMYVTNRNCLIMHIQAQLHALFITQDAGTEADSAYAHTFFYVTLCYVIKF